MVVYNRWAGKSWDTNGPISFAAMQTNPKGYPGKTRIVGLFENSSGRVWMDYDGKLHRSSGPAVELDDGTKWWYQHGKASELLLPITLETQSGSSEKRRPKETPEGDSW